MSSHSIPVALFLSIVNFLFFSVNCARLECSPYLG